jgi:hypothetical protein
MLVQTAPTGGRQTATVLWEKSELSIRSTPLLFGLPEEIRGRAAGSRDLRPDAGLVLRLATADVVVYPYQHTQESGSAAIKLGLASLDPVACTPLPTFDEGADVIHRLSGFTSSEIASQFEDDQPQPWPGFAPPADEAGSPASKRMRKRFLEYASLVENTE